MSRLSRHLIRAVSGPFGFGLFTITFLLIIEILFRFVDLFVSKGVPITVATKVMVLSLGHTLALSVPMAVLIAVLMGVGQLAADNEITAMKASGVSLYAILRPLLVWATVVALALGAFNHWVYPETNHILANLLFDIKRSRPMLEIRPMMFTDLNDRLTIYVREKNDRTGEIADVTIIEKEEPGDLSPRLTTAQSGRVVTEPNSDALLLELHDGEIHEMPDAKNPQAYQVIRFKQHDIRLEGMKRDFEETDRQTRSDREMNLTDLLAAARAEGAHENDVRHETAALQTNLAAQQWGLLGTGRASALGRGGQANPAERAARLGAVRRQVEQAASAALAQSKIQANYLRKQDKYLVEFHKKLVIPVACLVFTLLGIPMAVATSRSGRGVSVSLAMAVYVFSYLCLVGGEKIADRGLCDPALAMWSGNIILTVVGLFLFARGVSETTFWRRPRGHP